MQIVQLADSLTLRDLTSLLEPRAPRSAGVHGSDVIGEVMKGIDPELYAEEDPDRDNWLASGFLWERLISKLLTEYRIALPGLALIPAHEIVMDGIYLTPDWFECDDEGLIVSETKCTWKSRREWDQDLPNALYEKRFIPWLFQIRAYAYALGTRRARFHVLWINSDYSRFVPSVRSYALTFEPRELEENWRTLVNRARKLGWLP